MLAGLHRCTTGKTIRKRSQLYVWSSYTNSNWLTSRCDNNYTSRPRGPENTVRCIPMTMLCAFVYPCMSFCGRISTTMQVHGLLEGDHVVALEAGQGTWRERGIHDAHNLHRVPREMPLEAAATLCIKYVCNLHAHLRACVANAWTWSC